MLNFHDRPGNMLENYLNSICEIVNNNGGHAHKNQPCRSYLGKFISGEPFDYEIFAGGRVYVFDAKENMSGGDKWHIHMTGSRGSKANQRLIKQAVNLCNCRYNGAEEAFFLVAFNNQRKILPYSLVKYDAEIVYNALRNNVKYLSFYDGEEFDAQVIIRSLRRRELS